VHEEKHCIHKDIKTDNIIVSLDFKPYLADFGISEEEHDSGAPCLGFKGTKIYSAPEVFSDVNLGSYQDNGCHPPRDIWALGIVLYLLLYGGFPFSTANQINGNELTTEIRTKEYY